MLFPSVSGAVYESKKTKTPLKEGHWITLKTGAHVLINDDGEILMGYGKGGNIKSLWKGKQGAEHPAHSEPEQEHEEPVLKLDPVSTDKTVHLPKPKDTKLSGLPADKTTLKSEIEDQIVNDPVKDKALKAAALGDSYIAYAMYGEHQYLQSVAGISAEPKELKGDGADGKPLSGKYLRIKNLTATVPELTEHAISNLVEYAADRDAGLFVKFSSAADAYKNAGFEEGADGLLYLTPERCKEHVKPEPPAEPAIPPPPPGIPLGHYIHPLTPEDKLKPSMIDRINDSFTGDVREAAMKVLHSDEDHYAVLYEHMDGPAGALGAAVCITSTSESIKGIASTDPFYTVTSIVAPDDTTRLEAMRSIAQICANGDRGIAFKFGGNTDAEGSVDFLYGIEELTKFTTLKSGANNVLWMSPEDTKRFAKGETLEKLKEHQEHSKGMTPGHDPSAPTPGEVVPHATMNTQVLMGPAGLVPVSQYIPAKIKAALAKYEKAKTWKGGMQSAKNDLMASIAFLHKIGFEQEQLASMYKAIEVLQGNGSMGLKDYLQDLSLEPAPVDAPKITESPKVSKAGGAVQHEGVWEIKSPGSRVPHGNYKANNEPFAKWLNGEYFTGLKKNHPKDAVEFHTDNMGAVDKDQSDTAAKSQIMQDIGKRIKGRCSEKEVSAAYAAVSAIAGASYHATEVSEKMADILVSRWAGSSGDHNIVSLAMQEITKARFGMDTARNALGFEKKKSEVDDLISKHGKVLGAFIDAMYENTQEKLKAAGVEKLTLYRGCKVEDANVPDSELTYGKAYEVNLHLKPMSSFSTKFDTARGFHSNLMIGCEVPREHILGGFFSGYGCMCESEVVILHSPDHQARVIYGSNPENPSEFWSKTSTLKLQPPKAAESAATPPSRKLVNVPGLLVIPELDYLAVFPDEINEDWPKRSDDTPEGREKRAKSAPQKAAESFDETKIHRDHGKFAHTDGARGEQPAVKVGSEKAHVALREESHDSTTAPVKDKPITLVFGGSFSPVHKMHVQTAEDAKKYMEDQGYKVQRVVMAPSADKLLAAKLGPDLIPLEHRAEMARRATQDHPNIEVHEGPARESEKITTKLKRTQLADWAAKKYPDTTVVNVTGADAAPGHPPAFPAVYAGDPGTSHEGYYYLALPRDDNEAGRVSSSNIRKAVKEGKPLAAGHMHPEAEAYYRDYLAHKDQPVDEFPKQASRVGVPGSQVPEHIRTLPNLTADERAVETRFRAAYEKDPTGMAHTYREKLASREIGDGPNVFGTDEAKALSPDYVASHENRGLYNVALHKTANAIAKRAFVQHLDEVVANMPVDTRSVVVTAGGVASGKDFSIKANPGTHSLATAAAAVWNASGEQNSTEMPWVLEECLKRKIPVHFLYVHSDPMEAWNDPKRGVLARAGRRGRMVDALLFAESYSHGAQNFADFHREHKDEATFTFIDAGGNNPTVVDEMPKEALGLNTQEIYHKAVDSLEHSDMPEHIKLGGMIGSRIWGMAA